MQEVDRLEIGLVEAVTYQKVVLGTYQVQADDTYLEVIFTAYCNIEDRSLGILEATYDHIQMALKIIAEEIDKDIKVDLRTQVKQSNIVFEQANYIKM